MTTHAKKRVTLFLDSSLLKYAKMQAIAEEVSLTALVEEVLTNHLSKKTTTKSIGSNKRRFRLKK